MYCLLREKKSVTRYDTSKKEWISNPLELFLKTGSHRTLYTRPLRPNQFTLGT